jgi:hypothetical protein
MRDAILTVMRYIRHVTGVEPTQQEIIETLKSYFILNEIGNQIKYQLKKSAETVEQDKMNIRRPFWTLNLMSGPGNNLLARAGVFHKTIIETIQAIQDFMKKMIGVEPNFDIIAESLKSTFILSEIKNQIEWQRKNAEKTKGVKKDTGKGAAGLSGSS